MNDKKIDISKIFDGFQFRGHTVVDINVNGKKDSYCVLWLITGNRDKIIFSINGDYQEELEFDFFQRMANDNEINYIRYVCERYIVNSAHNFLKSNSSWFIKAESGEQ